jgi:ABC-type uncharacterized transport system substrate-binding protein
VAQHRIVCVTRRRILTGIAAILVQAPVVARGQQRGALRRLGVLMGARSDQPQGRANAAALLQGLAAFGWKEGGNLDIDWRWGGSDTALYERYARELTALPLDVILASNSPAVKALRRRTSSIPIVFATVGDPVGQGFVASFARPSSNITGFSNYDPAMAGKWLQMLTEIAPPAAHVAVLYNPATAPYADLFLRSIEEAASSIGVAVRRTPCHDDAKIETIMARLAREERGGLLVLPDAFTTLHRDTIVALAARYRVPAVYPYKLFAMVGGLMSYGINQSDPYRRAAAYIDRIFRGAKPGDLPVQSPTKFELVINLKTAEALGVTVATPLIAAADDVIE